LDDSLDAFSVHGMGGIFGALMTGVLATVSVNSAGANGLLYGNASLFWKQCIGVAVTIGYSALVTFVLLRLINAFVPLRNTDEQQHEGLDLVEHGEKGYHELA